MRYTQHVSKWAETGLSLRLFRRTRSFVLCQLAAAFFAINGYGQTVIPLSPSELLATDPSAFAQWLEAERPEPVSAQDKAHILHMLPVEGEVINHSDAGRRKLAALGQLLRATGHDSQYEIKVIDIPQARIGLMGVSP
jgi:hypothetical protein